MYLTNPSNSGINVISPLSNLAHVNPNVDLSILKTKLNIDSGFTIESTDPLSNLANGSYEKVARINAQLSILENALLSIDPDGEDIAAENKTNYNFNGAHQCFCTLVLEFCS